MSTSQLLTSLRFSYCPFRPCDVNILTDVLTHVTVSISTLSLNYSQQKQQRQQQQQHGDPATWRHLLSVSSQLWRWTYSFLGRLITPQSRQLRASLVSWKGERKKEWLVRTGGGGGGAALTGCSVNQKTSLFSKQQVLCWREKHLVETPAFTWAKSKNFNVFIFLFILVGASFPWYSPGIPCGTGMGQGSGKQWVNIQTYFKYEPGKVLQQWHN